MLGVYVHLPFCPYICPYCDFAKWPARASQAQAYLQSLEREIESTPRRRAATLFYGGGTPNTYAPGEIAALTLRLRDYFMLEPGAEITIEANPELVTLEALSAYRHSGITRLSLGVQSFVQSEIAVLGRRHTSELVESAVVSARTAGFDDVSIDLIFGVPGQTVDSWRVSLEAAIALRVDHVSTYGLTVEEHTPYASWYARDPRAFGNEDEHADMYALAMELLQGAGYEHYEISNFAKPGRRCAHNANYWANGEYIGLGVGAASYRAGERSVHTRELSQYMEAAQAGTPIPSQSERLEGEQQIGEAIMLALRTAEGVDAAAFLDRYGVNVFERYAQAIARYRDAGLLDAGERGIRLTERGRPVANDVCGAFLSFD